MLKERQFYGILYTYRLNERYYTVNLFQNLQYLIYFHCAKQLNVQIMAQVTIYSDNREKSVVVDIDNVTDDDYEAIKKNFINLLQTEKAFEAIASGFLFAVHLCPKANPSDLWQHIIYRTYIEQGRNGQSWKRASGHGFEVAFTRLYNPHLAKYGIRMAKLSTNTAVKALGKMGLNGKIAASKMDVIFEGYCTESDKWKIFGVAHFKASLAERIQDDAPASRVIMNHEFISVAITLDSKSYPPPFGNGINYGELGGRTSLAGIRENQPKRDYFEKYGDFTNCYSYNLRTPASPSVTESGSRIKTLSFAEIQPDDFVKDISDTWEKIKEDSCAKLPDADVS
jgi:hypothetical protein